MFSLVVVDPIVLLTTTNTPEGLSPRRSSQFTNPKVTMAPFVYTGPGCEVPKDVVTITAQHGVTEIGEEAFMDCESLTSFQDLPDTLTSIGKYAFTGCTSLTSLQGLPDTLTSIGDGAFQFCRSLM